MKRKVHNIDNIKFTPFFKVQSDTAQAVPRKWSITFHSGAYLPPHFQFLLLPNLLFKNFYWEGHERSLGFTLEWMSWYCEVLLNIPE